jgi:hypothetical protein
LSDVAKKSDEISLRLTSHAGFDHSVFALRTGILSKTTDSRLEAVNIALPPISPEAPEGKATLIMDPKDAYVYGFKGGGGIYMLKDGNRDVEEAVRKSGLLAPGERPHWAGGLGTNHNSLGTFQPNKDKAGERGRSFGYSDLQRAAYLSSYEGPGGPVNTTQVAGALSLLICMTSESARSDLVANEFSRIYFGQRATADTAVKAYEKACKLTSLAEYFPAPTRTGSLEKLLKRTDELNQFLKDAKKAGAASHVDKNIFDDALNGRGVSTMKSDNERLLQIQKEMQARGKPVTGSDMAAMLGLCQNQDAVRAAMGRVHFPIGGKRRPYG